MSNDRYMVPALERGLRLLQLYDRSRTRLSAPEIARELDIPRASAFRLIQTLERFGLLERTGNTYRLGPGILRLGFEYLASLPLTELARPVIEGLRDVTGMPAQLAIRDGREIVFVVRAAAPSAFASNVTVGTRMPAHATALGRILLCDLSDAELRSLYAGVELSGFTAQTPRRLPELQRLLAEDRARGAAVSESFFERGISAVAAPVRDHTGRVVAAVSVTVLHPVIEPAELRRDLERKVVAAAAALSHRLNFRPAPVAA